MRVAPKHSVRKLMMVSSVLLAALAMAVTASSALAAYEFSGKIGPKTWTCDHCIVEHLTNVEAEATGGEFCVGFTDYYGGAFHFPYGWECDANGSIIGISFPSTEGSAAVENPSSNTYGYTGLAW